jgi:hypothetical protein
VKQSDILKYNNIDAAREPATDDLANIPQTLPFIDTIQPLNLPGRHQRVIPDDGHAARTG